MKSRNIILVALAPIYDGNVLWVDQLFDFLNVLPDATIYLPSVRLNDELKLEQNKIIPLLEKQYEHIVYYKAEASVYDAPAYLRACDVVMDKIKGYFTFEQGQVRLEQFNDPLYWALARQYELLLSAEFQATFNAVQRGLIGSLVEAIKTKQTDAVVIVPLEHAAIFKECLEAVFEEHIFTYGEDFLADEG